MQSGRGPGGGGGNMSREHMRRMKESVNTGHRTGLPKKLLDLFAPQPHLQHSQPVEKKKPALPYTGLAAYLHEFASPGDPEYEPPPPADRPESPRLFRNKELAAQCRLDAATKPEKLIKLAKWRVDEAERIVQENIKLWNPKKDQTVEGDPFKTVFVAGLSYDVTEKKLRKEFEEFGPVKRVKLVHNKQNGKPRGYAFVEFEHKKDFKDAYKLADGRKIEGRRIVVDFERGRTVENWRPRRLGGGLGGQGRLPKEPKKGFVAAVSGPLDENREPRVGYPDRREPRGDRPREDSRRDMDRGRDYDARGGYGMDRGRDREPERDGFRDRERKRDRSAERPLGRDEKRRFVEDGEVRDGRRERKRERDL